MRRYVDMSVGQQSMNSAAARHLGKTGERSAFTGLVYACQFLYGGWFLFHGLNYWCEFYFDRSIQPGPGLVPALVDSGVMAGVKLLEILIGLALLLDLFSALAIVMAWPITLMIAFVTASHLKPFGMSVAAIIIALNAMMSLGHLDRYRSMLAMHAGPPSLPGAHGAALEEGVRAARSTRLAPLTHGLGMLAGITGAVLITYLSLVLRR